MGQVLVDARDHALRRCMRVASGMETIPTARHDLLHGQLLLRLGANHARLSAELHLLQRHRVQWGTFRHRPSPMSLGIAADPGKGRPLRGRQPHRYAP